MENSNPLEISDDEIEKPFSNQQAADYLGMTAATMNKWRCTGEGPRFMKVGRLIKYRRSDLDEFLQARLCRSTSEFAGRF